MNITVEEGTNSAIEAAASAVREAVFGCEWQVALPQLSHYDPARRLTVIARDAANGHPVAALTVVETTGETGLHRRAGLKITNGTRVARYTQLAVLKQFRGLALPARLILEARRRFVGPKSIDTTWLFFDADRAKTSSLCNLLGFHAGTQTIATEYGRSRVLTRNESAPSARINDARTMSYLNGLDLQNGGCVHLATPIEGSAIPGVKIPPVFNSAQVQRLSI